MISKNITIMHEYVVEHNVAHIEGKSTPSQKFKRYLKDRRDTKYKI